jgi:cytochrome c553
VLLAAPSPGHGAPPGDRFAACAACHGEAGQSSRPETPSLGGQPAFFVVAQLFLFREGRRDAAAMAEVAGTLTDDDLRAFAERVAALPPPRPPADPPDPARAARGRALAHEHHCDVCHRPDFSGQRQVPRLAAQREDYLIRALRGFHAGTRIGYGGAMTQELVGLTDGDLLDLAHFLAHLGP